MLLNKTYKITIVGSGYVGMSIGTLLALDNEVLMYDINAERVKCINNKKSTVEDDEIDSFLKNKKLNLSATTNIKKAYIDSDFIVISTPTDFDNKNNKFDTSIVDKVVSDALKLNKNALIIIKSTIPVGHTQYLQNKFKTTRIIFSPEFLREGNALTDNLYPSRIIIGGDCELSVTFSELLVRSAYKESIEVLFVKSSEAEAIKLFSNAYLAMRVSFFNELDSFALQKKLDSENIINGVCLDDRIGSYYNNPSFGYGGYCLPKDTKQLLAAFNGIPQELMQAIVQSNIVRKDFIVNKIINTKSKKIGFYKLAMKKGSDNFRSSAIVGIIDRIKSFDVEILIYEPRICEKNFLNYEVISDLEEFKSRSDIIIANRNSKEISDVSKKVFSRDIFNKD